jgi:thiamine biosynthesis lipoprotein
VTVTPSTIAFPALGTTAAITVLDGTALGAARDVLIGELEAIDRSCSRFRDDSELVALNRSGGRPFRATPLLLTALRTAVRAAELTGGDVDPTVGRSMCRLGWDVDFSVVVSRADPPRIAAVPAAGWRRIEIGDDGVVRLPKGVELDLGATAKALAADRAAHAASEATGSGVLVNLGGDISVAGPTPEGGWPILVTDDHRRADADGQTISIQTGGLATSSTVVRRWRAGGSERHHILHPRTGLPSAEIWRTVSVAAASCVDANTASTAAIVRGHRAPCWLEQGGLPARLVGTSGAVTCVAGWPSRETK